MQVSKTGETRDLKMGMAMLGMIAKIQSAGIFFFQLRNIHAEAGNWNHQKETCPITIKFNGLIIECDGIIVSLGYNLNRPHRDKGNNLHPNFLEAISNKRL